MNRLRLHIDLGAYALLALGFFMTSDATTATELFAGAVAVAFAGGMFLVNLLYNLPEPLEKDQKTKKNDP